MYMATQIQTRKQRGDMIQPQDIEQINSSSYFVKSQTGKSGYAVTRVGQSWSCDCPDHKYRDVQCKHIIAVEARTMEHQAEPTHRFSLGLWEAPK
jgi:SWIM zinc finger